jgi:hypothetical protein
MNPRSRAKAADADVKTLEREPNDFTHEYPRIGALHESQAERGRKQLSNPP